MKSSKLPSSREEQCRAASEFERLANGHLPGRVSDFDGIVVEFQKPGKNEVSRPGLAHKSLGVLGDPGNTYLRPLYRFSRICGKHP